MNKTLSRILCSGLVVAVAIATVLCCDPAMAMVGLKNTKVCPLTSIEKTKPTCHHCKPSANNKEDTCCLKQLQADQSNQISIHTGILQHAVSSYLTVLSQHFCASLKSKFNLAYLDGPPGSFSETPLYILSRSFRI